MWTLLLALQVPAPDPKKVEEAVNKAAAWITANAASIARDLRPHAEVSLWALLQTGRYRPETTEGKLLLDAVLKKELLSNWQASAAAIALERLNRKTHQWRIAQCAQMLADNQCNNGQWGDGVKTDVGKFASGAASGKIEIVAARKREAGGDNINSFFVVLAIRACIESQIIFEDGMLAKARESWTSSQNADGGWGYGDKGIKEPSNVVGTAAGIGSLSILLHYTGTSSRRDATTDKAVRWEADKIDISADPKISIFGRAYYLFAVETAGQLQGIDAFGKRKFYPEIVSRVLLSQKLDGSWSFGAVTDAGLDTGFAMLCLKPSPPTLSRRNK